MRTPWRVAILVTSSVMIFAGCAEDSDSGDDTSSTTTTEQASSDATDSTSEDTTDGMSEDTTAEDAGTIAEVASANPEFSTLVGLIGQAGLAEALSGDGPLTVFAPTNAAFEKVDAATMSSLAADPEGALADILKLHVVEGKIMAADAVAAAGTSIETLAGGKLKVEVSGETVTVGGAKVVTPDVAASNGVIHAIDTVITTANG